MYSWSWNLDWQPEAQNLLLEQSFPDPKAFYSLAMSVILWRKMSSFRMYVCLRINACEVLHKIVIPYVHGCVRVRSYTPSKQDWLRYSVGFNTHDNNVQLINIYVLGPTVKLFLRNENSFVKYFANIYREIYKLICKIITAPTVFANIHCIFA